MPALLKSGFPRLTGFFESRYIQEYNIWAHKTGSPFRTLACSGNIHCPEARGLRLEVDVSNLSKTNFNNQTPRLEILGRRILQLTLWMFWRLAIMCNNDLLKALVGFWGTSPNSKPQTLSPKLT